MEGLLTLWRDSGIYHMQSGQMIMIAVGVLLLFLAVRKGFEPLLLVPIGFGGILANIPGAGLAMSAVENAIYFAKPEVMAGLAQVMGVVYESPHQLLEAYHHAGAAARAVAFARARQGGARAGDEVGAAR